MTERDDLQRWKYGNYIAPIGMVLFGGLALFLFIEAKISNTIYVWNGLRNFEYGFLILGFVLTPLGLNFFLYRLINGPQYLTINRNVLLKPKCGFFLSKPEEIYLNTIVKLTEESKKKSKDKTLKITYDGNKTSSFYEDEFENKKEYLSFIKTLTT